MGVDKDNIYHECMQLTSQFKFCPNAFRVDLYRGCDFGCKYCFANMEAFKECGTGLSMWRHADVDKIADKFRLALETDKESKSVVVEMLRHRVPIHCGGMSDPFQSREWDMGLTYRLIELSNKYDYPIMFSTKTNTLPREYYDILNPKIHAFQVSIMGASYEYAKKWESNTPRPTDRIEFVQLLREDFGLWCGVRIQPVIDVEECSRLIQILEDTPSYYSIEHLHVIADSHTAMNTLLRECIHSPNFTYNGGVLEFKYEVKLANMRRLMAEANAFGVKVGCADNDLHWMSQSRCCCGVDLCGEAFENYLKYNLTYLSTGEADLSDIWIPQSNVRRHMNIGAQKPTVFVKDVVDNYIGKNLNLVPPKYRENLEKSLFGGVQEKLF